MRMTCIAVVWTLKDFEWYYKDILSREIKWTAIDRERSRVYISINNKDQLYWRKFHEVIKNYLHIRWKSRDNFDWIYYRIVSMIRM